MSDFLRAVDEAMKADGIEKPRREHVINRLLYGTPYPCRRQTDEITVHVVQHLPRPSIGRGVAKQVARQIAINRH
jgi:hypothetical protein